MHEKYDFRCSAKLGLLKNGGICCDACGYRICLKCTKSGNFGKQGAVIHLCQICYLNRFANWYTEKLENIIENIVKKVLRQWRNLVRSECLNCRF